MKCTKYSRFRYGRKLCYMWLMFHKIWNLAFVSFYFLIGTSVNLDYSLMKPLNRKICTCLIGSYTFNSFYCVHMEDEPKDSQITCFVTIDEAEVFYYSLISLLLFLIHSIIQIWPVDSPFVHSLHLTIISHLHLSPPLLAQPFSQ